MSKLIVTVKNRMVKGISVGLEGSYQLPNSTPAKLARKDGTTVFPNRGLLTQAAQRLATALDWTYEMAEPVKKATNKKVKVAASSTNKMPSSCVPKTVTYSSATNKAMFYCDKDFPKKKA